MIAYIALAFVTIFFIDFISRYIARIPPNFIGFRFSRTNGVSVLPPGFYFAIPMFQWFKRDTVNNSTLILIPMKTSDFGPYSNNQIKKLIKREYDDQDVCIDFQFSVYFSSNGYSEMKSESDRWLHEHRESNYRKYITMLVCDSLKRSNIAEAKNKNKTMKEITENIQMIVPFLEIDFAYLKVLTLKEKDDGRGAN